MKKKPGMAVGVVIMLCMTLFLQGCQKKTTEEVLSGQMTDTAAELEKDSKESDGELAEHNGKEPEPEEIEENMKETVAEPENEGKSSVSGIASPASSGALHVEGNKLTDSEGRAVQLKGISTHGIAWFSDYINADCFKQLREEWNVNVIRLAMYTAESGGYCSGGDKEELKTLVKNGVEYATQNDMYVIIDWHVLSDKNPNTYIEEAKDFFAEMSAEYADYNNVLYEICNEPNGETSWSQVKSYAEEVIAVIRANDEDGIILVGTPNWSQYVDQAAADPITGYENIMYTLHFYAATHTDWLRDTMEAAIAAGLPVFVSEYGICDASGNGAIDEAQAEQWVNAMDACGVSYVAWNLSNKNETSAIIKSGCSKTSGFTENGLSDSGKWLYNMLTEDGVQSPSSAGENGRGAVQNGETSAQTDSGAGTVLSDGTIEYTATLKNSWESEGKTFYQYDLTLQNVSADDCTKWAIDVSFNDTPVFVDGWNGEYTVEGSTLHIACKDYNGSIPAGGSVSEVGFIINGGAGLNIVE